MGWSLMNGMCLIERSVIRPFGAVLFVNASHGFPLVTRGCYEVSQGGMGLFFIQCVYLFSFFLLWRAFPLRVPAGCTG